MPPASWTANQAPTAITIARRSPTQAGQFRYSLSTRNLMTVKARMRKPSTAPVIASDTGMVKWAAASRTTSHAIRTIVRSPMMIPTPCQPLTPPRGDGLAAKVDLDLLPVEEAVDQQQHASHEHDLQPARQRVESFHSARPFEFDRSSLAR